MILATRYFVSVTAVTASAGLSCTYPDIDDVDHHGSESAEFTCTASTTGPHTVTITVRVDGTYNSPVTSQPFTLNGAMVVDATCTLVEAVDNANDNAQTHADCPAGLPGRDWLALGAGTHDGPIAITDDLSIAGAGAGSTSIDGHGLGTVVTVASGVDVEVSGVTITGGQGAPVPNFVEWARWAGWRPEQRHAASRRRQGRGQRRRPRGRRTRA